MDQELKTGGVGSSAGRNENSNPLESLLATASGTSTHNPRDHKPSRNTVGDDFIPIYSSLDQASHHRTHGVCCGHSSESSSSRIYLTPLFPERSSMINGGHGKLLLLTSPVGNPFSSFGQMSGRFFPSSSPFSSFRGMMSPNLSSTHSLFGQTPFRNTQTFDEMFGYPSRSSLHDEGYDGPTITEIFDDDDEVQEKEMKKKKEDDNGSTGKQPFNYMHDEGYDGPIITEIYDDDGDDDYDDDDDTDDDDDDDDDDLQEEGDDKKKEKENGTTGKQSINDKEPLGEGLAVTNDAKHKLEYSENTENKNHEEPNEMDTNDQIQSASEIADIDVNQRHSENAGIDKGPDVCYVTESAQSKMEDHVKLIGTSLQSFKENNSTSSYTNVDPNQSVHTVLGTKEKQADNLAGSGKRSFRTQSLVNTPLLFEDMVIGQNASKPNVAKSPTSLLRLEIDGDEIIEMKSEDKGSNEKVMEKIEVVEFLTDLNSSIKSRDVEDVDMANEQAMPGHNKNLEDSSMELDKNPCHGTSSLIADAQLAGNEEIVSNKTHSFNSIDCDNDTSEGSEHKMNNSISVERKTTYSKMSKTDVLSELHKCQDTDDIDQQQGIPKTAVSDNKQDRDDSNMDDSGKLRDPHTHEDFEFKRPSNKEQFQSRSHSAQRKSFENATGITTPMRDKSNEDMQWQYPRPSLQQGRQNNPSSVPSSDVSSRQMAHENMEGSYNPHHPDNPFQKEQQQLHLQQHQQQQHLYQGHQQHQQQHHQQQHLYQEHQQQQHQGHHHQQHQGHHQQQHQRHQQQQPHQGHHHHACTGHPIENGSQILTNSQHSPENMHRVQQTCSHYHVNMYHICENTAAYMCLDCGLESYVDRCCHSGAHAHSDPHKHGFPNGHDIPSSGQLPNKTSSTSMKKTRNKNASVRVNKFSTENSEENSSSSSFQSSSKNEHAADQYKADGQYDNHGKWSNGLNVLVESVGLQMKDVIPDGNCLFTAITDQLRIRGDFSFTARTLRCAAVDYLRKNPNQDDGTPLSAFLDEHEGSWDEYLNKMSREGHWGDHIVISALAHVLNRRFNIYSGNNQLICTVVEPHVNGKLNNNESSNASSNESSVDDTTDNQEGEGNSLEEMYLGHVSDAHYVSLRPLDWKDKLMQELKNKPTSCLIGCNPESRKIGKDGKMNCGIPCEHFTFATKYIQMSDIIFTYKKSSYIDEKKMCRVELNSPVTDIMNAHIVTNHQEVARADSFLIPTDTIVVNSRDKAKDKDLLCVSNDCLPGYTKLVPIERWRWPKVLDKEHYLTHLKVPEIHKPKHEQMLWDTTLAFTCEWPMEAQEWIKRPRKYGWPPEHVMADIHHHCCLVVPQSHPSSDDNDTEWKFSFDKAEHVLAEEALSDPQLDCFHIIKLMLGYVLKDCKIGLQVLKQVFFYTCEELDDRLWHCDTLTCIHVFLDRMLTSLRCRFVKGYFLEQENFLDDELDGEVLDECIRRIEILKSHTFPLLYFTFDAYIQLYTSMNMLFDRLIEDVLMNAMPAEYNFTIHNCFLPLVTKGILILWQKKRYNDAFHRSKRAVHQINSIRQTTYPLSQQDVILSFINSVKTLLDKWLYAFWADLNLGASYVDTVSDQRSTTSLHDVYGPTLADYVHEKHGSLRIPFELIQVTNLGQTTVAFLDMLEQLHFPINIYSSVISQCSAHADLILSSVPSVDTRDKEWMIHDVKQLIYKIQIHNLQQKIETVSCKTKMVDNLLTISKIQKALGNLEQSQAAFDEANQILDSYNKTGSEAEHNLTAL